LASARSAEGAPFAPTPVATGRTGAPAGGLPLTSTLTNADADVVAGAGLTAHYRADTALDRLRRPRGYTTVTVVRHYDDGAPTDTTTAVHRQFTVTVTRHGRDIWTGSTIVYTDFITITQTGEGWRITALLAGL